MYGEMVMKNEDIAELHILWDYFKQPRANTEWNNKLMKRLKELVNMKLRAENERKS